MGEEVGWGGLDMTTVLLFQMFHLDFSLLRLHKKEMYRPNIVEVGLNVNIKKSANYCKLT